MTNTVASRVGQINKAGNDDALFLKQFGGEILTEFQKACVFKDKHFVRQISDSKTATFPSIGTATTAYHTPGNWIDGQAIGHAETTISIDGLLYSSVFVQQMDDLENYYDVRGPYATELGRALAYQYDLNVAETGLLAARKATNDLTGRSGGSIITSATMLTASAALSAGLFAAAQALDTKNIPSEGRNGFFRPAQFYLMAQDTNLINQLWGGEGGIAKGEIDTLAGIKIIKTNQLPSTDLSADAGTLTKYRGNYLKTAGLVMNNWAVGTVQLLDISLESEWEIRRQGTFMIAKLATGHGILRPECSVELANT
jgi:hypothetical protein